MTEPQDTPQPGGELVPFTGAADTHYEVALDDGQAAAEVVHPPGGFGLPAEPGQLRPVIPEHLRTPAGVAGAARRVTARQVHRGAYHGIRAPGYLLKAAGWAVVGLVVTLRRMLAWWWVAEQHNLASETGLAGDPAAARELLAELLPVRERIFGPEHPETLADRQELASWTGEAGDPGAARDLFAGLLPVLERVSGPEHPDTLIVRAHLARWTGEGGDPPAARDQYARLLPVRERVLGPEHPDTLITRANRALWTGGRATRPPPGTSTPSCCRCSSGSLVRSTETPWAPALTSLAGLGRRGPRLPPGTSTPGCCLCSSGSPAQSTQTP